MNYIMILEILFWIVLLLITITVHEYAHGRVAYFFGDTTARDAGRLTLNPLKHIDPFWTVVFPLLMILLGKPPLGMARPVPVNFMALRNPKRDMIWVAAAGACANILFAAVLSLIFHLVHLEIVLVPIYFNLGLAVFNLVPIPPLDGSRILLGLLPNELAYRFAKIERYGFIIVMVIIIIPQLRVLFLDAILLPGINMLCFALGVPSVG
jgi:Zn-dependent protease